MGQLRDGIDLPTGILGIRFHDNMITEADLLHDQSLQVVCSLSVSFVVAANAWSGELNPKQVWLGRLLPL